MSKKYLELNYDGIEGNKAYIPTKETLEAITQELKSELFPIGKIEVFFDSNDHSNYLGFSWERCLIGRAPVGINPNDSDFDTIGKQVGEKTHQLTIDEMPSHNHTYKYGGTANGTKVAVGWHAFQIDDANKDDGINPIGGNLPHNNVQPSETVAFWKRIN